MTITAVAQTPYAIVPRIWPGETVVIVGGGTSLTPEDVQYCFGKARVIAIKEAFQLAPWADVLYACEEKWWKCYKGAPDFLGLKYALEPQPIAWPGVNVLENTGNYGLEVVRTGLRNGYNSGYQAVNLAVHLGAAKIILLGFDMSIGASGQQNWFGPHPNHLTGSPYPIFRQSFSTLEAPLKALGIEVINATRFTLLTGFPRMTIEEALP